MSTILDLKLYNQVKKLADTKFQSKTGVYKSSWIVSNYKKLGGKYGGKKPEKDGLSRWYKEKWVNLNKKTKNGDYIQCGRKNMNDSYPVCRPLLRISKDTPKTVKELSVESINKAIKAKKNSKYIKF
jgi:hypothetical protein